MTADNEVTVCQTRFYRDSSLTLQPLLAHAITNDVLLLVSVRFEKIDLYCYNESTDYM